MRKTFLRIYISLLLTVMPSFLAHSGTIQLPQTGQTTCWNTAGTIIDCAGTGQDGEKLIGATLPNPRFAVNMQADGITPDGTITDNLTGLVWLKNANCTETVGSIVNPGSLKGQDALTWSNALSSGKCGLYDGSSIGQWRLPNINELESLVNREQPRTKTWLNDQGFTNVKDNLYWSSSSLGYMAYVVDIGSGDVGANSKDYNWCYVWPVRDKQ